MGACCSTHIKYKGRSEDEDDLEEKEEEGQQEELTSIGHGGAIVRLRGFSSCTSMYTRKGKKGINQDAMTVWENFMGEKNVFFCGVFDGHGPSGHRVARYICENLPHKLSVISDNGIGSKQNDSSGENEKKMFSSWEANLIRAFEETDEDLILKDSIDSYCSGTTAVTIVKQGEHLIISNLGDSRAILCTRDNKNQLVPVELSVDLKPSLPSEAERILRCGGRVFAMDEEPNVPRVWMPTQNCPGLAMSRAFGDFCLKDHGLSAIPQVTYRRLTSKDEFIVLATDGIWDVLTNNDVIRIVASVKKQSMAAKILVYYAVQAWRSKYPGSKVDDCAVVCLFLKKRPALSSSLSDMPKHSHLDIADSEVNVDSNGNKTEEGETVINCDVTMDPKALEELNRVNGTYLKNSRFGILSRRKTSNDLGLGGTGTGTEPKSQNLLKPIAF